MTAASPTRAQPPPSGRPPPRGPLSKSQASWITSSVVKLSAFLSSVLNSHSHVTTTVAISGPQPHPSVFFPLAERFPECPLQQPGGLASHAGCPCGWDIPLWTDHSAPQDTRAPLVWEVVRAARLTGPAGLVGTQCQSSGSQPRRG